MGERRAVYGAVGLDDEELRRHRRSVLQQWRRDEGRRREAESARAYAQPVERLLVARLDDPLRPMVRFDFATDGRTLYLTLSDHQGDISVADLIRR